MKAKERAFAAKAKQKAKALKEKERAAAAKAKQKAQALKEKARAAAAKARERAKAAKDKERALAAKAKEKARVAAAKAKEKAKALKEKQRVAEAKVKEKAKALKAKEAAIIAKAKAAAEAKGKKEAAANAKADEAARRRSTYQDTMVTETISGSPLGTRYICFECAARFYDLNRPEPLCPKCGADQREKPKTPVKPPPRPKGRVKKRSGMAPLLDEDEEEFVAADEDDLLEVGLEETLLEKRGVDEDEEP